VIGSRACGANEGARMVRQSLVRRLKQVERTLTPRQDLRVVVIFEGPGSERFPRPTEEEIAESHVIVVRIVAARDGRPAESPAQ
jgi:hypothetical protein